jgi:hypothetical protein
MRINHPKHGDERIRTFFAWLPVYCESANQSRWWEMVTVEEFYTDTYDEWKVKQFIDDPPMKASDKAFKRSNEILNEINKKVNP